MENQDRIYGGTIMTPDRVYSVAIVATGDMYEDDVEFSCRKHARKVAEAWGELPAYRRKRLEIRHKEKARRERLKNRV